MMEQKDVRWVAVKIIRGFPDEVRGFSSRIEAEIQEQKWRKTMNFDYDETGVLPLKIVRKRTSKGNK